ncbi:four-helix bundle copper-binding protein [Dactylosporangium sp. AC04546]|uniref:four-helix bundle copper-binding protein n=1 Tax=Dactylosporangium sp. AC04546 TaxID=2862460 RepID=UPI001EE0F7AD|nr:four-helix bundle copper-binding protein [Dactylosporangium sp. AC04546]WVK83316.1 four-helix bundle copper-binding protein [Dactylosporangium sp. AC04546]
MTTTMPMIETYPQPIFFDRSALATAIDVIANCGQTCTACADACLSEEMIERLAKCIRLDLDCADVCAVTARMLTRHTGADVTVIRAQLEACAAACRACADECTKHAAMHQHCRICAEMCRRAEQACRDLISLAA